MIEPTAPWSARSFSVGFLSFLGGQTARFLLSFPVGILIARLLGPAAKGEIALALLLPALLTLVATLGAGQAASYLVGSRRYPVDRTIGTLAGIWLLTSTILLPSVAASSALGWLSFLAPGVDRGLLVLASLLLPLLVGRQYLAYVVLGQQRFIEHNLVHVLAGSAQLIAVILLVWSLSFGKLGAVVSAILAEGMGMLFLLWTLRASWDHRPRLDREISREALSYGLRGQIGNILQFFNYRLDIIILGHFRDLREVGLYALAVSIGEFLWYVPNAGAMVIFPKTAHSERDADRVTPLGFRITGAMTLLGALVLALVARPAITFIYGPLFRDSASPLLLLLPGIVCLGASKILSADLSGRDRPGLNSLGALLSLVVTVCLDLVLIPRYGMNGAALASSFAYGVTLVYSAWAYRKVTCLGLGSLLRFGPSDVSAVRDAVLRVARPGRILGSPAKQEPPCPGF